VNLASYAVRNVLRNRFRTTLTILGVAITAVTFLLLRTVLAAWTVAADYAAQDRVGTRHKVTFVSRLPLRYFGQIQSVPGVTEATYMDWFGGKDPKHEKEFFATLAVDAPTFFSVYDDMAVEPSVLETWKTDRTGAIVGDVLAKKMGWKPGDKIILSGTIYPGEWTFRIAGLYRATRKSVDNSTFIFHWNYLNETVPPPSKDLMGWVVSRVGNSAESAAIAKRIDALFDSQDIQTLSMSERAMNTSFLGMFSAVLSAVNIVSVVILFIMALVLGNTIAMGVRERTQEFGALRAIGFLPKHLTTFVLVEAAAIGGIGGLVGLALGVPFINQGMGKWIEENMGSFFPYFQVPLTTAITACVLCFAMGLLASAIPAYQASRINVLQALRRVN
jgi:putative ABC transport system permease protein